MAVSSFIVLSILSTILLTYVVTEAENKDLGRTVSKEEWAKTIQDKDNKESTP